MPSAWLTGLAVLSVGCLGVVADVMPIRDMEAYNAGTFGSVPNQTFHSTDIVAPVFGVSTWNSHELNTHSFPYLFINGLEPNQSSNLFILNATDLSLVWALASTKSFITVMNFQPQMYSGKQYLTFWEGNKTGGYGKGNCILYDQFYQQVYQINPVNLSVYADFHECKLTEDGTALISVSKMVPWDLRSVGGIKNDTLVDFYFQEIDIATGEVIFSWAASDHFTVEDSFCPYSQPYDFFHLNSVSKSASGDFLISSRHLHMVTLIAGKDSPGPGSPIWILNGKRNQFTDQSGGAALDFSWQHHVQLLNKEGTGLLLFDNHSMGGARGHTGCMENCSKAMHLSLDSNAKTVRLQAVYTHPQGLISGTMGSVQVLSKYAAPGGNIVVGWGSNPSVTEYSLDDGSCVMDIQFGTYSHTGLGPTSYRAFKADWVGIPKTNPDVAANWETEQIWVSWNGATEVRSWAVYIGDDEPSSLTFLKTVVKEGFETTISVAQHRYVQVKALDSNGKILGSTGTIDYSFNHIISSGCT